MWVCVSSLSAARSEISRPPRRHTYWCIFHANASQSSIKRNTNTNNQRVAISHNRAYAPSLRPEKTEEKKIYPIVRKLCACESVIVRSKRIRAPHIRLCVMRYETEIEWMTTTLIRVCVDVSWMWVGEMGMYDTHTTEKNVATTTIEWAARATCSHWRDVLQLWNDVCTKYTRMSRRAWYAAHRMEYIRSVIL